MVLTNKAVLILGLMLFAFGVSVSGGTTAKEPPGTRIFEGITPCTNSNSPVPQIAPDTLCELMIWHLTLNPDAETGEPTTYTLQNAYGMSQPNTTGIAGGGTPLDLKGTWAITRGIASAPDAEVYQLNADTPEETISLVMISDYLLHVLTQERTLMVGHGGWSYTLNRTDAKPMVDPTIASQKIEFEDIVLPKTKTGSPVLGVFEGRTPCAELISDFTGFPHDSSCTRIKWQLTLSQDPEKGQIYSLRSVETGTEKVGEINGMWKALHAPQIFGDTIIYHLSPHESDAFLLFMQVDENHLFLLDHDLNFMVGDALWSYTLSNVFQSEA